jgi:protein TonB
MLNEKRVRLLMFLIVALIHIVLIFFLTFKMKVDSQTPGENARMMRLTDFSEIQPEPPPPPPPPPKDIVEIPQVESIAETMIETEEVPEQIIVEPGAITVVTPVVPSWDDYIPQGRVKVLPKFNEKELYADLVYPPIAQRSGIEGRVILELFVDLNGHIQRILIMQENPKDRGFGEAAVKAFTGKRGTPAYDAEGKPVSMRYRYPVSFVIKK